MYKAPWGYDIDENNNYIPIEDELEALESIYDYIKSRQLTFKDAALWLSDETGRSISYEGLRKRLKRPIRLEEEVDTDGSTENS